MRRVFLAIVLAGSSAGAAKPYEDYFAADSATVAQVAAMTEVKDDPMETAIRISTEPFYQPREKGFLGKVLAEDTYLRARIDRATGKTIFEVLYWREHPRDWENWDRGNVMTANGPVEVRGYDAGHDVSCGRYGCNFTEAVALPIPEDVIRWAGTQGSWSLRIKGRYTNGERDTRLLGNEIAGFLQVVDRYRPASAAAAH